MKELETELANLRGELHRLERELGPRKVFTADDQIFLTWVLGFTAGANLERDAERGERIFARCRELVEKMAPVAVPPIGGS